MPARQLIVNADDFGFTRDVNDGIVEAHRSGIVTAATLMANGEAFDHAVSLAHANPALDIGCHLVLLGGNSLLPPYTPFPTSIVELARAAIARRIDFYAELKAQVERILCAGLRPTHLDTHKHSHVVPPVLTAMARIAEEYGIRWVRRPFDFPLSTPPDRIPRRKRLISRGLQFVRDHFHAILERHGCHMTDCFAGFLSVTDEYPGKLLRLLPHLPEGSTEFMCHPGYYGPDLRKAPTGLMRQREIELKALVSREVKETIQKAGIRLSRYEDL